MIATQACKRCHARKRKCDRKRPRCTPCQEADVSCEQELRASEKTILLQFEKSEQRANALQERVHWLEELVASRLPSLCNIASIATDATLAQPTPRDSQLDGPSAPSTPLIGLSRLASTGLLLRRFSARVDEADAVYQSAAKHPLLPSLDLALSIAFTHLSEFKQSHHITDEEEAEKDIRLVYGDNGLTEPHLAASRYRCFALLYTGMLSVNRSEDRERCAACRRLMLKELEIVLAKEDLLAVQALAFLGIVAIDEPGGPSLFQICGLAARTAMSIRIHRRDDVYLPYLTPFASTAELIKHNERRKNVFWAVYSLDRLAMHVLSQPPAIRDSDIDVDLPTIPAPKPGLLINPSAALRVHNIIQRRLYGRIQDAFYAVNVKSDASIADREAIVFDFRREIQQWYDTNPLKIAFVPVSPATIARQCLDDLSYHQMVLALHRPSRLIPDISSAFVTELLNSAGISVDLYRHYWKNKQVLINWIHLYQIFTSCITLVYCFCEHRNRSDLVAIPIDTVNDRIVQCRELLLEFAPAWPESSQYQLMFDSLVASSEAPPVHIDRNPTGVANRPGTPDLADSTIVDLLNTLADTPHNDEPAGVWTPNEVMRAFGLGQSGINEGS